MHHGGAGDASPRRKADIEESPGLFGKYKPEEPLAMNPLRGNTYVNEVPTMVRAEVSAHGKAVLSVTGDSVAMVVNGPNRTYEANGLRGAHACQG
jgi:hypothetical protein